MKRLNIVTGHYGSGKTEFALNLAKLGKKCYNESVIADLDIVNPYFRTNDAADFLKDNQIELIASHYASSNVDVPALPPEVYSVFDKKDRFAVLDVGGDEDGAAVLGRFSQKIASEDYDMFFIINTFRPLTRSVHDILEIKNEIEGSSRLKITGLVNNSNLGYLSSADDILSGQAIIEEVSEKTGLPILYITGRQDILDRLPTDLSYPKLGLELNMNLPFETKGE